MSAAIDVSICIVNWNGGSMLRDLLASLWTACGGITCETIVVDNASGDDSPDVVAREFPEVILVRNQTNRGFSAANNQAAERSRGRFLFFLNNDTIVSPGTIQALARFLDEHPDYSAVAPQLIGTDGKPQKTVRNFPTLAALMHSVQFFPRWSRMFAGAHERYRAHDFDLEKSAPAKQIAAAALMVRRDAFEKCGRWDEGFEFGVEDVDLCKRLHDCGPIYYLADVRLTHFGQVSSHANRGWVYRTYQCGYVRYLRKNSPNRYAPLIYKTMVTLDMPVRVATAALQTVGSTLTARRDKREKHFSRLKAAGHFMLYGLPRFWKS